MDAFEEDHEKDMQDPEYARVWGETVKAMAGAQRRAGQAEDAEG